MKKIGTLILLFSVFGIFSAQKNDGLKISQSKSQYSINDTIPKIIYPQRWENNKTLVLLNEQPTSLTSLTTINPEYIENIKKGLIEKWFLEAVENKKNRDKNSMEGFREIMGKYVAVYSDNFTKIQQQQQ